MSISTITISAVNYTSYASVAEADAYLAVDPSRASPWAALTNDQKGANLVAATRRLDILSWAGEKTGGAAQEAAWPRTGVTYPDGTAVSTSEVPKAVENATILLAGSIAVDSDKADAGSSGSNIKQVKAGSAEVTFFKPTAGAPLQDTTAYSLVKPFLEWSGVTGTTGSAAYGTDGESTFSDIDAWGVDQGYP